MDETSSNLNLPYLQAAQAQKHVTHNAALERLDLVVQLVVQSWAETVPPLAPDEGEVWAIGSGAVNDWVGHDLELAGWSNGGWVFVTPRPGWRAAMGGEIRVWNGAAWALPPVPELQNLPGVGVNTSYDATNKLAVASAATLFTNVGNGHQLKVNKAANGDTASLLFQTSWSGRAEMGTLGDDNFGVKVSADGSAWTTALQIGAGNGNVGIGTTTPPTLKLMVMSASDASIGNRSTSSTSFCGLNLYDYTGATAASFQYGNPSAGAFTNEFVFASRQSTIPIKFYQGGISAGNERLRIDASGQIALINANVGVGTTTPAASARLEVASTTQGFLPPRMTTTQRDAIGAPAEGLMLYNTTDHRPQVWSGSTWGALATLTGAETFTNKILTAPVINTSITGTAVTQSFDDTTAGRLLKVGDFGLGRPEANGGFAVLNSTVRAGFYHFQNSDTDKPFSSGGSFVVSRYSTSWIRQIAFHPTTLAIHVRQSTDGGSTWGTWSLLFGRSTVLGAVSQSGGVPTGALVERGSNANGEYVRLADGTQICTFPETLTVTTSAIGSVHYQIVSTWTFPAAFVAAPVASFAARGAGVWGTIGGAVSTTGCPRQVMSASALSGASVNTFSIAIGRWF